MQAARQIPLDHDRAADAAEAGLEARFAEIYRAHFEYVWQSAYRLGVAAADVDDVVQETFLLVHRMLGTYEDRGTIRGWLFSLLYRVVQRHKRSLRSWLSRWDTEAKLEEVRLPRGHSPDRLAETEEEARRLEAILAKLNPEQRAVLVLTEIEERPMTEVAEILGLKLNTARSRLRLARQFVETSLARHAARDRWRVE